MRRCILLLVLLWAPVVWAEPRVGVDPPEALVGAADSWPRVLEFLERARASRP